MSSGTFGYPLGFAAFFAAIGLIIRSPSEVPVASAAEKAASEEIALYHLAMSNFLSKNYKETLKGSKEYLARFPNGRYLGDIRYRVAFIDFNDKDVDQSDKIIRDLTSFLNEHPNDAAAGSMYCLLADTYKKKTSAKPDEFARFQQLAIDAYRKAAWSASPPDVIEYALDSASAMLQDRKVWAAIARLHEDFLIKNPDSLLALQSIPWVAKARAREGKNAEAVGIMVNSLKSKIGNPSNEQVEPILDELVKAFVPRKKLSEIDLDAVDKQLVEALNHAIDGEENATTRARISYARSRLARLLKRIDPADLYLNEIATINASDPSGLSPALLAGSGDILLKLGRLDQAQAMFQRLIDHYNDSKYADAGPIGLGYIALAGKKPADALRIFEDALGKNPATSWFKEATLGKLESMLEMSQLEDAEKLAIKTFGDRRFRGEAAGRVYLLLGRIYLKHAKNAEDDDARIKWIKKAGEVYQRVHILYRNMPDIRAEAYWQAYESLNELGNKTLADDTLNQFMAATELRNTARYKMAAGIGK